MSAPPPTVDRLLLDTLSEAGSFCDRCRILARDFGWKVADFNRLARLAAQDRRDRGDWDDLLGDARHDRDTTRARVEAHLAEPHEPPPAPAAITKPPVDTEPDDRVTCPECGRKVTQGDDGRLQRHKARSGAPCRRRFVSVNVEAPPPPSPPLPALAVCQSRVSATPAASRCQASGATAGSACGSGGGCEPHRHPPGRPPRPRRTPQHRTPRRRDVDAGRRRVPLRSSRTPRHQHRGPARMVPPPRTPHRPPALRP